MAVKVKDLENMDLISTIAKILNDGNEVHIKKERDNVVVVEQRRKVKLRLPTDN